MTARARLGGLVVAGSMVVLGACGTSEATDETSAGAEVSTEVAAGEESFSSADLEEAEKSLADIDVALESWYADAVRCVREKGWEGVVALPDGLSFDELPRDQAGAFEADLAECEEAAGPAPNEEPLSRAEIAVIYHRWVDAKTCLEDLGYEISDPPSLNVYIEDYLGSENGPWSPFVDLPPSADLTQVKQTCPE